MQVATGSQLSLYPKHSRQGHRIDLEVNKVLVECQPVVRARQALEQLGTPQREMSQGLLLQLHKRKHLLLAQLMYHLLPQNDSSL